MKSVIRGASAGASAKPEWHWHSSVTTKLVTSPYPCQEPEGCAGGCARPGTPAAWGLVPLHGAICSVMGTRHPEQREGVGAGSSVVPNIRFGKTPSVGGWGCSAPPWEVPACAEGLCRGCLSPHPGQGSGWVGTPTFPHPAMASGEHRCGAGRRQGTQSLDCHLAPDPSRLGWMCS